MGTWQQSPLPLIDTYLPFRCKLVSAGPHPFTCPLNENAVIEGDTAQNHETKQAIKRTSPAVTSLGTTWLIFVRPASYQSYYLYRALLEGRANPESPSPRRTRFVNQILMQILVFVSFFLPFGSLRFALFFFLKVTLHDLLPEKGNYGNYYQAAGALLDRGL